MKRVKLQNTNSVKQLSKMSSTVHLLHRPSGVPLYLRYIHCTARREGVKVPLTLNFLFSFLYCIFNMPLRGIVVSALAWHSLGREIESCPRVRDAFH